MKLEPLTLAQCEQVRIWRNKEMECWRTSQMLTAIMQKEFYENLSERDTDKRYWAIISSTGNKSFIGMGGINNIQWENRIGEITLIINPEYRHESLGEQAVDLLLNQGFNHLNLQTICGECYECNSAWKFWQIITNKYIEKTVDKERTSGWNHLPRRKYWQGRYWNSLYFSIDKDDFNKIHNSQQSQSES